MLEFLRFCLAYPDTVFEYVEVELQQQQRPTTTTTTTTTVFILPYKTQIENKNKRIQRRVPENDTLINDGHPFYYQNQILYY